MGTFMSMWCRELVTNPLVISTPLVMIMAAVPGKFRVKVTLLITFLQAMTVLPVHLKFLGKVAASTNRDLVTSSDMMVSVKELCLATDHSSIALVDRRSVRTLVQTPDQVLSSEARAPPCLMILAPKYQAKVPLSLTQPTAKYLARIHNFLKERACRAMAPRSLMVLIVIRQVRGRSRINPERSSLTTLKILLCVLQARVFSPRVMGPSRIVQALSFLARVLSLNNQELK